MRRIAQLIPTDISLFTLSHRISLEHDLQNLREIYGSERNGFMLRKHEFLSKFIQVTDVMPVYSQDGEKLGKVVSMDEDGFTIEKGFFFPKNFTARYDDVVDVHDGKIVL